jgi:hypothetical protein
MNIVEDNIKIYRSVSGASGHDISEEDWREIKDLELHRDQLIAIVNRKMQKILYNQSIS